MLGHIVNVPPPVQFDPPVNAQVPEMAFQVVVRAVVFVVPVAVPVMLSELLLPCTVKVTLAVAVGSLAAEVTSHFPPTVSPATGKHGPVVRKFKTLTFKAPLLLTENVVMKLNRVWLAGGPTSVASQLPPAAVVAVGLVEPHPARKNPSANSPMIAIFFMNSPSK